VNVRGTPACGGDSMMVREDICWTWGCGSKDTICEAPWVQELFPGSLVIHEM